MMDSAIAERNKELLCSKCGAEVYKCDVCFIFFVEDTGIYCESFKDGEYVRCRHLCRKCKEERNGIL